MAKDFNHPKVVERYDEHIRKLIPGYTLIHAQVHAILNSYCAEHTHILVVGCGTGYELQYLTEQFPTWHFTAIDPAINMLNQAKQHLDHLGLSKNVRFIHADTTVLHQHVAQFDAALAILVSHFIPLENKQQFFDDIAQALKKDALCLSYDLMLPKNAQQLLSLKNLAQQTGLNELQSQVMLERLADDFHLIETQQMLHIYHSAGLKKVDTFSQVLNYYGFIGFKSE